jgi:hypothetical protein
VIHLPIVRLVAIVDVVIKKTLQFNNGCGNMGFDEQETKKDRVIKIVLSVLLAIIGLLIFAFI